MPPLSLFTADITPCAMFRVKNMDDDGSERDTDSDPEDACSPENSSTKSAEHDEVRDQLVVIMGRMLISDSSEAKTQMCWEERRRIR